MGAIPIVSMRAGPANTLEFTRMPETRHLPSVTVLRMLKIPSLPSSRIPECTSSKRFRCSLISHRENVRAGSYALTGLAAPGRFLTTHGRVSASRFGNSDPHRRGPYVGQCKSSWVGNDGTNAIIFAEQTHFGVALWGMRWLFGPRQARIETLARMRPLNDSM
jgi:hypothetical protein